jgi:hypothetical protein
MLCSSLRIIVPMHALKEYRGNGGLFPLILNAGTRYRRVACPTLHDFALEIGQTVLPEDEAVCARQSTSIRKMPGIEPRTIYPVAWSL